MLAKTQTSDHSPSCDLHTWQSISSILLCPFIVLRQMSSHVVPKGSISLRIIFCQVTHGRPQFLLSQGIQCIACCSLLESYAHCTWSNQHSCPFFILISTMSCPLVSLILVVSFHRIYICKWQDLYDFSKHAIQVPLLLQRGWIMFRVCQ